MGVHVRWLRVIPALAPNRTDCPTHTVKVPTWVCLWVGALFRHLHPTEPAEQLSQGKSSDTDWYVGRRRAGIRIQQNRLYNRVRVKVLTVACMWVGVSSWRLQPNTPFIKFYYVGRQCKHV